MIWFGALILYGKRVKFMIEFNAHKNEWVEFPLWLREQLEQYLATNRETPMSYLIPRFRYRPRIEVFPPDDIDLDDDDPVFAAGIDNCIVFMQTMRWFEDNGVIELYKSKCERTFLYPIEEQYEQEERGMPSGLDESGDRPF